MRGTCSAVLLVLVSACASIPAPESTVTVYNLRQGLARKEPNGEWKIYAEGGNFLHQVNGDCVADGKTARCMWFGAAFDFSANAETTVLTCKGTFSAPTDLVSPKEVVATKTSEHTATVDLRGRTGKVFWEGYSIADGNTKPHTTSVTCEHRGKQVLRYAFTITEPPDPTVKPDARKGGTRGSP